MDYRSLLKELDDLENSVSINVTTISDATQPETKQITTTQQATSLKQIFPETETTNLIEKYGYGTGDVPFRPAYKPELDIKEKAFKYTFDNLFAYGSDKYNSKKLGNFIFKNSDKLESKFDFKTYKPKLSRYIDKDILKNINSWKELGVYIKDNKIIKYDWRDFSNTRKSIISSFDISDNVKQNKIYLSEFSSIINDYLNNKVSDENIIKKIREKKTKLAQAYKEIEHYKTPIGIGTTILNIMSSLLSYPKKPKDILNKPIQKIGNQIEAFGWGFFKAIDDAIPDKDPAEIIINAITGKKDVAKDIINETKQIDIEYYHKRNPISTTLGEVTGNLAVSIGEWELAGTLLKSVGYTKLFEKLYNSPKMTKFLSKMTPKLAKAFTSTTSKMIDLVGRDIVVHGLHTFKDLIDDTDRNFKRNFETLPKDLGFDLLMGGVDIIGKGKFIRMGIGAMTGALQHIAYNWENANADIFKSPEFWSNVVIMAYFNIRPLDIDYRNYSSIAQFKKDVESFAKNLKEKGLLDQPYKTIYNYIESYFRNSTGIDFNDVYIPKPIREQLNNLRKIGIEAKINENPEIVKDKKAFKKAQKEVDNIIKNTYKTVLEISDAISKGNKEKVEQIKKKYKKSELKKLEELLKQKSEKKHINIPVLTMDNYKKLLDAGFFDKAPFMAFGDIRRFKMYNTLVGYGFTDKYVLDQITKGFEKFNKLPESKIQIYSLYSADEFIVIPKKNVELTKADFKKEMEILNQYISNVLRTNLKITPSKIIIEHLSKDLSSVFSANKIQPDKINKQILDFAKRNNITGKTKKEIFENLLDELKRNKTLRGLANQEFDYLDRILSEPFYLDFGIAEHIKNIDPNQTKEKAQSVADGKKHILELCELHPENKIYQDLKNMLENTVLDYDEFNDIITPINEIIKRSISDIKYRKRTGGRFDPELLEAYLKEKTNQDDRIIFYDALDALYKRLKTKDTTLKEIIDKQRNVYEKIKAQNIQEADIQDFGKDIQTFLRDYTEYLGITFKDLKKTTKVNLKSKKAFIKTLQDVIDEHLPFLHLTNYSFRDFNADFQTLYNRWISGNIRFYDVFHKIFSKLFSNLTKEERDAYIFIFSTIERYYTPQKSYKQILKEGFEDILSSSEYGKPTKDIILTIMQNIEDKKINLDKLFETQKVINDINDTFVKTSKYAQENLIGLDVTQFAHNMGLVVEKYKEKERLERINDLIKKLDNRVLKKIKMSNKATTMVTKKISELNTALLDNNFKSADVIINEIYKIIKRSIKKKNLEKFKQFLDENIKVLKTLYAQQQLYNPLIVFKPKVGRIKKQKTLGLVPIESQMEKTLSPLEIPTFKEYIMKDPADIYTRRYADFFQKLERVMIIDLLKDVKVTKQIKNSEGKYIDIELPLFIYDEKTNQAVNKAFKTHPDLSNADLRKLSKSYFYVDAPFLPLQFKGRPGENWKVLVDLEKVFSDLIDAESPANAIHKLATSLKMAVLYKFWFLWKNDVVQMAIADPRSLRPRRIKEAIDDVLNESDIYKEAMEQNVFNFAIEMNDILKQSLQDVKLFYKNTYYETKIGKLLGKVLNFFGLMNKTRKKFYTEISKWAWLGDKVGRMALYKTFRENGFSPQESADKVQLFMAHYDRLNTKARRNLGIIFNYISYRIAMLRLWKELLTHPWKNKWALLRAYLVKLIIYPIMSYIFGYKLTTQPATKLVKKVFGGKDDDTKKRFLNILTAYRYFKTDVKTGEIKATALSSPIYDFDKILDRTIDTNLLLNLSALAGSVYMLIQNQDFDGSKITDVGLDDMIKNPKDFDATDYLKWGLQAGLWALSIYFPPIREIKNIIKNRKQLTLFEQIANFLGTSYTYVYSRKLEDIQKDLGKAQLKQDRYKIYRLKRELARTKKLIQALRVADMYNTDFMDALEVITIQRKAQRQGYNSLTETEKDKLKKFFKEE